MKITRVLGTRALAQLSTAPNNPTKNFSNVFIVHTDNFSHKPLLPGGYRLNFCIKPNKKTKPVTISKPKFDNEKFRKMFLDKIIRPLVNNLLGQKSDVHRNTLDPFSALIDCALTNSTFEEWRRSEIRRQFQKTLQNKVGEFHQIVVDCFDGWEDLQVGKVVDAVNKKDKLLVEIKNKFNTTKGNHKVKIYDDFATMLDQDEYKNFTCYYVEIIPKHPERINVEFAPSDNTKTENKKRPTRQDIRRVDGATFYEMVSKDRDFIFDLFSKHLPDALNFSMRKISSERNEHIDYLDMVGNVTTFAELIEKAYGKRLEERSLPEAS